MKRPTISKPADAQVFLKILIYGPSGTGKTRLAASFPRPILFDTERGTLSIRGQDVAVVSKDDITPESLSDYANWLNTPDAKDYDTVIIDSLTELQSQFLADKLPKVSDPRQAYGLWSSYIRGLLTVLYTAKKNVVLIARSKLTDNQEGSNMIFPELTPGAWTHVPALVDYAFYLVKKTSGLGANAVTQPMLYTDTVPQTNAWAKSRTKMPREIAEPTYNKIAKAIKQSLEGS